MKKHPFALAAFAILICTAACQTGPSGSQGPAPLAQKPGPPAFVEAACGDCHSVEPPFLSPNENAPSFAAIANQDGLTNATLAGWLSDAHNYPEVMDFGLDEEQIEMIADYMITLRREDYVPAQ